MEGMLIVDGIMILIFAVLFGIQVGVSVEDKIGFFIGFFLILIIGGVALAGWYFKMQWITDLFST